MSARAIFAAPALSGRGLRLLWALVLAGSVVRLIVAFSSRGVGFDIDSYELVRDALSSQPFEVYSLVNEPDAPHWPYPSLFFAWIVLSDWANGLTGLRFDGFVQVAPIAADAALAWVVQAFLGQRGASERTRLAAAALVALGPSFAFISGYHGQVDAVSILPAVVALWVWTRLDGPQRALVAGGLVGLGGSVKIGALLLVLALLPTARSVREGVTLLAAAAAVPLLLLVPWLLADPDGTFAAVRSNDGLPGFGGLSLLVQPDLSALWLQTKAVTLSSASERLFDVAAPIALASLLLSGALMLWRRTPPVPAAVLLWLTFYAFGVNFGLQYLVWGIPFFLLAGRLRSVLALQAAVLVPTALIYGIGSRDEPLQRIYTPIMLLVWAGFVVWFALELRRSVLDRDAAGVVDAVEQQRSRPG